jgi:hypothetical protein
MKRRQFFYWLGAGLFGIGETLGIDAFDRMAAAATILSRRNGSSGSGSSSSSGAGQRSAFNTGKAIDQSSNNTSYQQNYSNNFNMVPSGPIIDDDVDDPTNHGKTEPKRLARQGRPPSRWLRSLDAEELRKWLKTVNPAATGVNGMSYASHLIHHHLFVAEKIAGLTVDEQAKLHAAAHAGY